MSSRAGPEETRLWIGLLILAGSYQESLAESNGKDLEPQREIFWMWFLSLPLNLGQII